MTIVTIHKAKTELSKLIEMAVSGQQITIAKGKTPMVTLTPVKGARKKSRGLGAWKGQLTLKPGWNEDLSPEDMGNWEDTGLGPDR
jgi:antitoxin (DNA-binding transcriptional repressor) of toxin-antitoxin stability system